ncbi:MAG TPA: SH3 domain-containing C40 family peptidase, partial [Chthonomonadales bacterium]|nr:SH3 domain-containing C40 family peptidase [Chthonomonadales bacterium]
MRFIAYAAACCGLAAILGPASLQGYRVHAGAAVVRSGPGTRYHPLGCLTRETVVRADSSNSAWLRVSYAGGGRGWIRRDLLSPGGQQQKPVRHPASHEQLADRNASSRSAYRAPLSRGELLARSACTYRGIPYRYGGVSRNGFDCSGFTRYLFGLRGIALPHSARAQAQFGVAIPRTELRPGDLVFFHTVTRGISHVGVYVGKGKFVHASSRREGGVREDSLSSGYYRAAYRAARRVR